MKERAQWLVARRSSDDGRDKAPVAPNYGGGWNEDQQLLTFEEALETANKPCELSGVRSNEGTVLAFRFTDDGPFVGIDIDDLQDLGEIEPLLDDLSHSYTEWSVSGTGLHIITRGSITENIGKVPISDADEATLEAYDQDHYFTVTGDVYDQRETISRDAQDIDSVLDRYTPASTNAQSMEEKSVERQSVVEKNRESDNNCSLTAEEVIENGLEGNDSDFNELWRGGFAGTESHSEADFYLACKLAYHCWSDRQLMDECFRRSGLFGTRTKQQSPKWDQVHYSNGDTYGERTLDKAIDCNGRTR